MGTKRTFYSCLNLLLQSLTKYSNNYLICKGAFGMLRGMTMGMSLNVVVSPSTMKDSFSPQELYMEYEIY